MPVSTTLFAWAVPAFVSGSPVDHTWVTAFDNRKVSYPSIADVIAAKQNYWFCWGGYHAAGTSPVKPAGFLGSKPGNLPLAICLVAPNADSRHVPAARGTIFKYGVDGVCHQLANQVLYATGKGSAAPLTVKLARGYVASCFVYGTYGLQHAAWAARIASCSAANVSPAPATPHWTMDGTNMPTPPPDDFAERARSVLADEPELLGKLLSLRGEVQSFASQPIPGRAAPSAIMLNSRNQHFLDEAARILGPQKFEAVFGFKATVQINLVDETLYKDDR